MLKDGQIQEIGLTSQGSIIAVGPLHKQPYTTAYRYVLIARMNGGYMVAMECHNERGFGLVDVSLSASDYFLPDQLVRALETFANRLLHNAKYFASLYRCDGGPKVVANR